MENQAIHDKDIDISFCLPVYNVADYIEACIVSITSQQPQNYTYEIICVDDGSSDASWDVLETLQLKYPQVKIFKNETNKGVCYTRNHAVDLASGKYIWFIDPDDMLYPGVVEPFFLQIEQCNGDVILGNYKRCADEATLDEFQPMLDFSFEIIPADRRFLPYDDNGRVMSAIWAGLFRKQFLTDNNLRFQEGMIAQEDTLFYVQFSLRTDSVIKCNAPCYLYRQRPSSVMHSKSAERGKKYYKSMRIMYDVYYDQLVRSDYRDKESLLYRIHQMKQNIALCLARITDTAFVKQELKEIKQKKLYPFPFRTEALTSKYESLPTKIIFFLLPIELWFWLFHYINKIAAKRRAKGKEQG